MTPEARRLHVLYGIARTIAHGGERTRLIKKGLEQASVGLCADHGLVDLGERARMPGRITHGSQDLVVSRAVLDAVLRRHESVVDSENGYHAVAAPLLAVGRSFGFIYVRRSEPAFNNDDRAFLELTAHLMTLAIMQDEREARRERVAQPPASATELLGDSQPVAILRERLGRFATARDTTVLIRGESGTGKGLVARRLHALSPRADGPFIAVNCAAMPDTLIESELFGHEKGAFTGAGHKRGKFALAHGGTIFLDEVGDLSQSAQAKVLRVVEDHEIQPLGSEETLEVDVRILSATHKSLEDEIAGRRFRQDLYYRLAVAELVVPPLRERGDDILLLADMFLQRAAVRNGRRVRGFSTDARDVLSHYGWPGNVRQLANEVERALLLADGDVVELDDLRARLMAIDSGPVTARRTFADAEREALQRALDSANGSIRGAARTLELSRNTLYRKLRKYDLIHD